MKSHADVPRRTSVIAVLISVLLLASSFAPAATAQTLDADQGPGAGFEIPDTEFVETECPYDHAASLIEGEDIICGTVSVPLDYEDSDAGNAELLVIHIPSTSDDPADEPLVVLNGGPGGTSALPLTLFSPAGLLVSLRAEQDIILFDQRGVGESTPSLACTPSQDIVGFPAACVQDHQEQGIDHVHFTVDSNAADVASIANAFDVEQVDLYGLSYGTFLGQVVQRDHPEAVRSAIFHLPVPMEDNLFATEYIGFDAVLTTVFEQCEADENCPGTVESLNENLQDVVNELGTGGGSIEVSGIDPMTGERGDVLVTDVVFVNLLYSSLYHGYETSRLPALISQTADGETAVLESMFSGTGPLSFEDPYDGVTMGALFTNVCQEQVPFTSYAETQDAIAEAEVRPAVVQGHLGWDDHIFSLCDRAGLEPSDPVNNEPVTSEIPTLIVTGELDPRTPPFSGEILAEHLENSYLVNLPGVGHGWQLSGEPCMTPIMREFLEDPSIEPDTSCIDG